MYGVALGEKELAEIRAVLTRYAGDESDFVGHVACRHRRSFCASRHDPLGRGVTTSLRQGETPDQLRTRGVSGTTIANAPPGSIEAANQCALHKVALRKAPLPAGETSLNTPRDVPSVGGAVVPFAVRDQLSVSTGSKRILVTGGAGFLGSHLCKALLHDGHEVLCVDNFFTSRRRNIKDLLDHKGFELLRHDITFPLYVEVDEIYNLACPASPIHYQFDPVQTTKTSVIGAINVLGLAKRLKVKVLQASTSEIYGDPSVHPQTEDYWGNVNTLGPRACYDEGKRCAETLFFDYFRQHKTRIKVVRIFNTYGPNMHPKDGRVVSNFIVQALQGRPITLYGDGLQTRSFCYCDDLIVGIRAMMDSADEIVGPINIGNPGEFTMLELAQMVLELTGSKSQIVHAPLPLDDPRQRQPDISLARRVIGWEPTIPLKTGLERTIAYFEELLRESAI